MRKLHIALLAVTLFATEAFAAEIRTISDRLEEDVVSIAIVGGRAILKTSKREIPLEQVKQIRFDDRPTMPGTDSSVILANRDELRGPIQAKQAKNGFFLETTALGTIELDYDAVAAILHAISPDEERKFLTKDLEWLANNNPAARPAPDSVHLKAGGKATGTLLDISSNGVKLEAPGIGAQLFPLKDVKAVVVGSAGGVKAPAPPAGTLVRVRCDDGTIVSGAVQGLQAGKLTLAHITNNGGVTVDMKHVLDLYVLNGNFTYLSDLTPVKVDEKFPEGLEWTKELYGWKRDREVCEGGRLRLGGRAYDKGLGVHSYCSLEFQLGGGFKEFRSVIGLDDSIRHWGSASTGSVTFRVLVDGKPAAEMPEGRVMKRGDKPEEISINVRGAKTLTLVVDYAKYMHILGRADWADAHLVK